MTFQVIFDKFIIFYMSFEIKYFIPNKTKVKKYQKEE